MEKQIWFNKIFMCIRIISYILIIYVIVTLLNNNSRFTCVWNEKYGILCPSCGATRATLAMVKGNFLKAMGYNLVYAIAVFPIIAIFIFEDVVMMMLRGIKFTKKRSLLETLFDIGEEQDV